MLISPGVIMDIFDVPHMRGDITIEKNKSRSAVDMPDTHFHSFHELYFLLSGERRYIIGHKIYDVAPGNLVVIKQNEIHKTSALNSKGYERYVLYFNEKCVNDLINYVGTSVFSGFLNSGCIQFSVEHSEKIRKNMEQIELEKNNGDAYSAAAQNNLLCDIILTALRYGKPKCREKSDSADKIQKVARYISENYQSEITLHNAAQMAYMEDTYFSKRFKLLTGFCFSEYLTQTRIKAAETLLVSSELNISEISDFCGFSSSNYFGDVFRRIKGVSPSEYRKKLKEN